ncbi:MAG: hypothetical protein K2Q06_02490 [Parvularculaceae bacterium]|nr:hypothetical protein [Parvularculaceae bacterium]
MTFRCRLAAGAAALVCALPAAADATGISIKDAAAAVAQTQFFDTKVTVKREVTDKGTPFYNAYIGQTEIFTVIGLGCQSVSETSSCEGIGFYNFGLKALPLAAMSSFNDDVRGAKVYRDDDDGTSTLVIHQVTTGASAATIRDQVLWMEVATMKLVKLFQSQATSVSYSPSAAKAMDGPAGLLRIRDSAGRVDEAFIDKAASSRF